MEESRGYILCLTPQDMVNLGEIELKGNSNHKKKDKDGSAEGER